MRNERLFLLAALALVLLACSVFPAPAATPPPAENAIATAVAGTLAAAPETPATAAPPSPTPAPTVAPQAAYVVDGDIWLWKPHERTFQLTSSSDARHVCLSPDGQIVAFVRALDKTVVEIWAVNTDGSNLRRLVSADDLARLPQPEEAVGIDIHQMAWIPHTHTLAYSTIPLFVGPGMMPNNDLRLVDADTLAQRTFLEAGQGGRFAFSPDGTRVVVSTASRIDLLWLDGRAPRQQLLAYPPVMTYSEYTFVARPQWASDGSHLLVFIPPSDAMATPTPASTVWYLPADGAPARQLGAFTTAVLWGVGDDTPLFDPTLTYLAYVAAVGENQALHIAAVDGSSDAVYASAPQIEFFGWAPSGLRFAYAMGENPPLLGQVGGVGVPLTDEGMRGVRSITWLTDEIFLFTLGNCTPGGCEWQLRFGALHGESGLLAVTTSGYGAPEISVTR